MKPTMNRIAIISACVSMQFVHSLQAEVPIEEAPTLASKSDKSGTNPINFTFDARFYNEYQSLNAPGDAWGNISTFEFRAPFADGKWQFRTRLRASALDAGPVDGSGFGDMDIPEHGKQDSVRLRHRDIHPDRYR